MQGNLLFLLIRAEKEIGSRSHLRVKSEVLTCPKWKCPWSGLVFAQKLQAILGQFGLCGSRNLLGNKMLCFFNRLSKRQDRKENNHASSPASTGWLSANLAQRSLADRDRGLSFRSSNPARWGPSEIALYLPCRKPCSKAAFTIRSSPEWKLKMATVPPGASKSGTTRRRCFRLANSRLTKMRNAWKTRAAGWVSHFCFPVRNFQSPAGLPVVLPWCHFRQNSASWVVVSKGDAWCWASRALEKGEAKLAN